MIIFFLPPLNVIPALSYGVVLVSNYRECPVHLLLIQRYTNQSLIIGALWELQSSTKLDYSIVFKVVLDKSHKFGYCSFANMAVAVMDYETICAKIKSARKSDYTQAEVATFCHLSKKTIYKLEQSGKLSYEVCVNHLIHTHKIKTGDILEMLKERHCRQGQTAYIYAP